MRIASYDKNFVCKCIVNNSCSSRSRTKLRIASWWSSRPVLVYGTHRPVCYAQTPLVRFMESQHLEEIYQQVPNMTATNRMPEQQVHSKLYNKSLTNLQQFDNPKWVYDKSTTIQQVEWLESEHDRNSVRSGRKCPKMTKNCSHGNSLEGQQPNFAGIIYAGRPTSRTKKGEDQSRTF